MDLCSLITSAQAQRDNIATQFDPAGFYMRRLEENERTLSVLTTRIEESFPQEVCLIGDLHELIGILSELRCHFEEIGGDSDSDIGTFQESGSQPILPVTRNGKLEDHGCNLLKNSWKSYMGRQGLDGLTLPGFSGFQRELFVAVDTSLSCLLGEG